MVFSFTVLVALAANTRLSAFVYFVVHVIIVLIALRAPCEQQTHFRSSLGSKGEKRRPEMRLLFAGYKLTCFCSTKLSLFTSYKKRNNIFLKFDHSLSLKTAKNQRNQLNLSCRKSRFKNITKAHINKSTYSSKFQPPEITVSLNFIRLLRVVITPERRKRLEAIG